MRHSSFYGAAKHFMKILIMETFLKSSRYHKATWLLKNGINLKNEYKKNIFTWTSLDEIWN